MADMDEVTHAHVAELLKRGDSLLDDVADFLPIAGVPELIVRSCISCVDCANADWHMSED